MEFPAGECRLENDIALAVEHKRNNVNVLVDRHDEHPLSSALRMLDNIDVLLLQNQHGNLIERDFSLRLEFGALFLIPNDIHGINVSHYAYNVKYHVPSAATAPNTPQHGARSQHGRR